MSAASAAASRRLGLRGRIAALLAIATLVTIAATVACAVVITQVVDVREQLIDRIVPADRANRDLLTGLVDQETGVRGFALTRDERFLEPYLRGQQEEADALAELRERLRGRTGLLARVDRAQAEARAWHDAVAAPALAPNGADLATSVAFQEAAKNRFDAFRAAQEDLRVALASAQRSERARLDDTTTLLVATLAFVVLALAAAGVALWIALRRLVIRPVLRLREDVGEVVGRRPRARDRPARGRRSSRPWPATWTRCALRIVLELQEARRARREVDDRADELARSNADLEQFAYVASHDLQEPLRKVASFCQLLQQRYGGQLDERADQYIEFAVDGAKRMQALINDLLAFSRVGRTTASFAPVELDDVLARVERLYAGDADARSRATLHVERPLPAIAGDASLLDALFGNLVGNSIKFRGEEPPRIRVAARRDDDGAAWRVTVADNGIGIDAKYAERVFVIFQRLHGRDVYPGTGIGLALCRRIVEYHGGRMWLDTDAPGPGTTFQLTFPPIRRATMIDPTSATPVEILLVEDDPGDVLMTREALADSKLLNNLHVVDNGEDAMAHLAPHRRQPRPDLILLDLNLPRMDGREVLAAIKQDEALKRIPVVVLTTSEAEEDVLRSYDLHANAYVTKPVDFDRFVDIVRRVDEFFISVVRLPSR